jgi:lipoprotein signal peptidase
VFNIADVALVVGVIAMIFDLKGEPDPQGASEGGKAPAPR